MTQKNSLLLFLSLACLSIGNSNTKAPNIILLLADDLGYGELGSYGQKLIETPELDRLAQRGMRFEQFYAGSSVCSPSRGVLMTGKHAGHATIRGNMGFYDVGEPRRTALRKDEITVAEMLKTAGYQTAFVGKWHLDLPEDPSTWAFARGFDFSIQEQWGISAAGTKFLGTDHWLHGAQKFMPYPLEDFESLDHFRTNLIMEFLDHKEADRPFFIFMSYRAPHGHERAIGNTELYADRGWSPNQRLHAAKITLLDRQVGRLLDRLEADGDLANTLILFTSDNGPHSEGGRDFRPNAFASSGPFRGIKRDMYEGGVRVPLIAYWPGKIEGGSVSRHQSAFYDIMPTFAQVAGIQIPDQSDGISFLPELLGQTQPEHDHLYFELLTVKGQEFRQAVRRGNLKAVRYGAGSPLEIYDVEDDPREEQDLGKDQPEITRQMEALLADAHVDVPGCVIDGNKPSETLD